ILVCSVIITYRASDGVDVCDFEENEEKEKLNLKKMFGEYVQVLELGPMRWLLVCTLFYLTAYTVWLSDLVYFLTFYLGFSSSAISLSMIFRSIISMIIIPPIIKLCAITDKRIALLIVIAFGCIGCVVSRFAGGMSGVALAMLVLLFSSIVMATYWQVVPALFYDVCEYDIYKTGKKREGAIVSVQGLVESISTGIGAQILGIILQANGFVGDAEVQSQQTMDWIFNCTTWVPVILMALAAFALVKYPISRKYYEKMLEEIKLRNGGK
ncbi:MAG: MFS transporter, partial [Bacillota bacterium]|nr:MFS transporter [Bacillota bacterium]